MEVELAGLLSLPVELVQHLSSFLSVEDVLSCSLTCHNLRAALNDNAVWNRYLPDQDLSRLATLEEQVEPTFQLEQTLTPLCKNRILFMRKTRLLNNWREGNFVEFRTKTNSVYAHGVLDVPKGNGELIYGDKYLFLSRFKNDVHSDSIEVWDIEKAPSLFTSVKMENVNYECFYIIGDYLVVVECIRVNVYKINLPDKLIPLAYSFNIDEKAISEHHEISHPGRHNSRCDGWSHSTDGQYLVSSKWGEGVIQVWDIVNASMVGSFTPPVVGFSMNIFSHIGNDWLIFQNSQSSEDYYLFRFSIQNKEFDNTFFHYSGRWVHMLNFKSAVIVFKLSDNNDSERRYDIICELYDFNSSKKLASRRFDNVKRNNKIRATKIFNGTFVMLCSDGFHVVDALTLDTVDHFQCDDDVSFICYHWNICGTVFIAAVKKKVGLEVWDVRRKKKLSDNFQKLPSTHLYLNSLRSGLASFKWKGVAVAHFW
uniref:F-box domain-containing protein n=1 Tax=Graphocephala atropunctata TaxID=36148 RepID=A0A1B6M3G3_9HEMI